MVPESRRRRQRSGGWSLACLPIIYVTQYAARRGSATRATRNSVCGYLLSALRIRVFLGADHPLGRTFQIHHLSGSGSPPPERQLT